MYLCSGWDVVCLESGVGAVLCPSVRPVIRRTLYTALYSSGESTDAIYYVYDMFAVRDVCISALVGM